MSTGASTVASGNSTVSSVNSNGSNGTTGTMLTAAANAAAAAAVGFTTDNWIEFAKMAAAATGTPGSTDYSDLDSAGPNANAGISATVVGKSAFLDLSNPAGVGYGNSGVMCHPVRNSTGGGGAASATCYATSHHQQIVDASGFGNGSGPGRSAPSATGYPTSATGFYHQSAFGNATGTQHLPHHSNPYMNSGPGTGGGFLGGYGPPTSPRLESTFRIFVLLSIH